MESKNIKIGHGCLRVLAIGIFFIFLILKLLNIGLVAAWPWIWIFSPLWIYVAFLLILFIVRLIIAIWVTHIKLG